MGSGAVTIMPGSPTDTATNAQGPSSLGDLGHEYYYNGSFYKLVKNASTSTATTIYQAVEWSNPAIGTATVTATTVASGPYLAGVPQVAIPANGYAYICTGGICEGVSAATPAAGASLYIDSTDGKWGAATAGTHHIQAAAVDTGVADTAFTIYLSRL